MQHNNNPQSQSNYLDSRVVEFLDKEKKAKKAVYELILKIIDHINEEKEILKNQKDVKEKKLTIDTINATIVNKFNQIFTMYPRIHLLVYLDFDFWKAVSKKLDFEELLKLELYHVFHIFFSPLKFYFKFIDYDGQFSNDKIKKMLQLLKLDKQSRRNKLKLTPSNPNRYFTKRDVLELLLSNCNDLYIFTKDLKAKDKTDRIKLLDLIRILKAPLPDEKFMSDSEIDKYVAEINIEKMTEIVNVFSYRFLTYINPIFLKKFIDKYKQQLKNADFIILLTTLSDSKNNINLMTYILETCHLDFTNYSLEEIQKNTLFKRYIAKNDSQLHTKGTVSIHPLFNGIRDRSFLPAFVFFIEKFKEKIFELKNEKQQDIFTDIVNHANLNAARILFWQFPEWLEKLKNQSPSPLFSLVSFEADEDTLGLKIKKQNFIKFLIDEGFPIDCINNNTSLINYIIMRNDHQMLEFILFYLKEEKQVDINSYINPQSNVKPLMQAGLSNDPVIFKYLNSLGASLVFEEIDSLLTRFFHQKQENGKNNTLNIKLLKEIINHIKNKCTADEFDKLRDNIWIKNIETFQSYRPAVSEGHFFEITKCLEEEIPIDLFKPIKNGLNMLQLLILRGPTTDVHEFLKNIKISGSDVISFKLLRFALMGDPGNIFLFHFLLNKIDGKGIEKLNEKIEPDSLDKISSEDIKKIGEQQRDADKEYIWPMTGELTITERRRLMPKNKMEYYLLSALEYQRSDIVKALLDKNIKIDMLDKTDKGALWYAIQYGHIDLIISLYDKGALFDASTAMENRLEKMLTFVNEKVIEEKQKNLPTSKETTKISEILKNLQKKTSPSLKRVNPIPVKENKTETLELEEKANEVDSLSQAIIIPEIENEVEQERKRAKVFSYQKREKQAKEENQSSSLPKNISSIFSQPPTDPIKMFLKNAGEYSRLLEGNTMDWNNCKVFIPQAFLESVNAREIGNLKELFAVRPHINEHHGIKRLGDSFKKIELWLDDNKLGEGHIVAELKGGGKHRIFFIKMGNLLIGALYSPDGAHGNAQSIHQDLTIVTFKSSLMPWNNTMEPQKKLGT